MAKNYEGAIFYNEAAAAKLGWTPEWFGEENFDEDLVDAIYDFQLSISSLEPDGRCGPQTFRHIYTKRQHDKEIEEPSNLQVSFPQNEDQKYLIYDGKKLPIKWKNVVLWDEPGGLKARHYRGYRGARPIKFYINHWDVTLNSHSTQRILNRRKLSVHLLVDGDGCVYQTCDLSDICFHAGGRNINKWSIGCEINNPYSLKYQSYCAKHWGKKRPIVRDAMVHGKQLKAHLGFYDIQKEASYRIWECLHAGLGLPLATPPINSIDRQTIKGERKGIIHHFHVTTRKIDAAGFSIQEGIDWIISQNNKEEQ